MAIATQLDAELTPAITTDDPLNFTSSKVLGSTLRIWGHTVTTAGPLTTSSALVGDQFGLYYSPVNRSDGGISNVDARQRGQNNNHEGVYIDDIIVGFAGRGEMVTGNFNPIAGIFGGSPDATPGVNTMSPVPVNNDFTSPQRLRTGVFELDVRRGTEYGASLGGNIPFIGLYNTFDVNDRMAQGFTLIAPPASELVDGQTFRITAHGGIITWEFDSGNGVTPGNIPILISTNDSAITVATKIRDAINNVAPTLNFNARAAVNVNGTRINLFGPIDVDPGPLNMLLFENLGDPMPVRPQGYTILQGNKISNTLQAGIIVQPVVDFGDETTGVQFGTPGHSGSLLNLPTLNCSGLVPGVAIKDNLLYKAGNTAIAFSGTPTNDVANAVPFGRIINNTIAQTPFGIQVVNNASPTILNNIVAETRTAIFVDDTSLTTVVGASIYQNNTNNLVGGTETNSIALAANAPLFIDSAASNFYLEAGSVAIDSSVNSLPERFQLAAVTSRSAFRRRSIQASDYDLLGQLRVDDPTVTSPPGLGSNVFKDRGALERSDFIGPFATLYNPLDNDPQVKDRDQTVNKVVLVGQIMTSFAIQLNDNSTGIDNTTVTASKFRIQRTVGGVTTTLTPDVDYTLSYDSSNNIALLKPSVGVWINGIYTITIDNSVSPIKDVAGNAMQPNDPSGNTRFIIELTDTATSSWQNSTNKYDVNNDGIVSGLDVILIVNRLLAGQAGPLPVVPLVPPYIDVSGDGILSPLDALQIINFLNSSGGGGGGGGAQVRPRRLRRWSPSRSPAYSSQISSASRPAKRWWSPIARRSPLASRSVRIRPAAAHPPMPLSTRR